MKSLWTVLELIGVKLILTGFRAEMSLSFMNAGKSRVEHVLN